MGNKNNTNDNSDKKPIKNSHVTGIVDVFKQSTSLDDFV